ncbi:MAG: hypothetical protein J1E65_03220 [Lachnospiraceae bacterium]|nr:hypothetical protein [Lachnospiraceae bacterium]
MTKWMKKRNNQKLNNRGSAIVMVIVVVAFISILATTLLYVAGANYYRKVTDLKNKESFYEAETALEEIRAALAEDVSKAAKEAYLTVSINYATADSATRYSLFQSEFFKVLANNWDGRRANPVTPESPYSYEQVVQFMVNNEPDRNYQAAISLNPLVVGDPLELHPEEGYAILKGVELRYTVNGYTTMISTDFLIYIPSINWGVDHGITSGGGDPLNWERSAIDMTDYVQYYNWVKK